MACELNPGLLSQRMLSYMTEVLWKYANEPSWNITFDFLAPVNEPNDGGWAKGEAGRLLVQHRGDVSFNGRSVLGPSPEKLKTGLVGMDGWAITTARSFNQMTYQVGS